MTDRPIIFSGPMILALLAGRKTQTRRILKPQPHQEGSFWRWHGGGWSSGSPPLVSGHSMHEKAPAQPGDRLWVREAWRAPIMNDEVAPRDLSLGMARAFEADEEQLIGAGADATRSPIGAAGRLRPSIFMPRWASRLTLLVTEVRVERLQDISERDAVREGLINKADHTFPIWTAGEGFGEHFEFPIGAFQELWEGINGSESWTANPWVAAISFTVHRANIDALAAESSPATRPLARPEERS